MKTFLLSFIDITGEMSPYLLLGFLIAGILHVYVPRRFYSRYLSRDNKWSVVYAALLGIPLPLCSCGVIPTAIGLKNENASKGAVASFLIATPQTGIDSILATFSLMGLGFAIMRPVAALVTGICGGLLISRIAKDDDTTATASAACGTEYGNKLWRVLKYAYYDMIQDIGARLFIGLLLASLITIAVPDEFFLTFGKYPLVQMIVILVISIPMYICSTGSIPIAAALVMKGLSPGAALVMLMAGPAVNIASILVVRKSMGARFTYAYLLTIVVFSIVFGMIANTLGIGSELIQSSDATNGCCTAAHIHHSPFRILCSAILLTLIATALIMKIFGRHRIHETSGGAMVYIVEGMHCNHCKAAVEQAVGRIDGVTATKADPKNGTLTVEGNASEEAIRNAVEQAGFLFKGVGS